MDAVEVDVQLFIKCRMCLDQQGMYQIAPNMIHIIKFCFDIDIELFDGLPQLICKSCKFILTEYNQIKTTFQEKQKILKEKLCKREKLPASEKRIGDAARENEVLPVETAVVAPLSTPEIAPLETALQTHNKGWQNAYQEHFVCIICNKTYLLRSSVQRHVKRHRKFVNRHINVFRNYCSVQLNKIDSKLNITGGLDVVVYNHEKIIANTCNNWFHTYFEKKPIDVQSPCETSVKRAVSVSSIEEIGKGKKKRKSYFSSSSNETTILEADCDTSNNAPEANAPHTDGPRPSDGARVSNEGTSSACPHTNKISSSVNLRQRTLTKPTINNYKTIQSIVAMCNKKLKKKILSDNEMINNKPKICESSLKRKVLSLGRKVINNKGFGCTGLLRYMEHKELAIKWQPVTKENQNKGSNFVRIMPKMKPREFLENDSAGWKDLEVISFLDKQDVSEEINEDTESNVQEIPAVTDNEENIPCSSVNMKDDMSERILDINAANDLYYNNKLQNKTPAANLKQFVAETKPPTVVPNESTEFGPIDVNSELANDEVQNGKSFMPIITSAKSLSTNNGEDNNKPTLFKGKPLIKVKPVSELMPERPLNNQSTSENIWAPHRIGLPCHVTSSMAYVTAPMLHSQDHELNDHPAGAVSNAENNISPTVKNNGNNAKNTEFVTLDTLELPNTKTRTPFQYFKMVLLYHGLGLLELNEELPDHYNCLVKFKLELKQDKKQPLGLLLSLFCSNNSFCFHFKDSKLKKFDPNQLPAFWQWELLKIYKSDVVKKALLNAAKIGKEVYENTDTFLCLLISINLIT